MQLLKASRMEDAVTSEAALVQRASARDTEAFADLYELHLGRIFRYFYYRLGRREDAEDLTEQVFLKAWQSIDGYDCRGVPFSAWLFRIAHNLLVDEKRSHRETAELDEALEIEDAATTPEELALLRMEARELADALRQLSPLEQSVVMLRFFEGLDHRAVAAVINKSQVACRSIQSRALSRLAVFLRVREGGET